MDTLPQPPGGRRSNGLQAAEWGALVDVDPRLSTALLDSLAAVGVPAYAEPAAGSVDAVSRAAALPKRPLDRLWVDASRGDEARAVVGAEVAELTALLAEEEPGTTAHGFVQPVPRSASHKVLKPPILPEAPTATSGDDPDEAWRQIVESWTHESDTPVPPWPVLEDVDAADDRPRPPAPEDPDRRLRRRSDHEDEDSGLPAWLEPEALDDDGHYVPPPPPPVPKVRRHTVGALVALTIGLVLVFAPNLIGLAPTTGLGVVGIGLMLGGAGALVWHMRDAPPVDRGPDDGAVV